MPAILVKSLIVILVKSISIIIFLKVSIISKYMHGAWVKFAKNGDPNGTIPILWEPYTDEKRTTFIFNDECSVEYNPNYEEFKVWKDIKLYN